MNTRLTPQDQHNLSAYIDGQLSLQEKAQVEQQLAANSVMRQTLEELRRTRALLRLTPKRRAPRNYTLKPEWVASRRTGLKDLFGWVPALRLSSAVASLAAFLLAAVNLLPIFGGALAPAAEPEMLKSNETYALQQIPAEAAVAAADEQPTPMIIIWGVPEVPGYGMGGGGPDSLPPDQREVIPQVTLEAENVDPEETALEPTPQPIEGSGPILGVRPPEEAGQIQRTAEEDAAASGQVEASEQPVLDDAQKAARPAQSTNPWLVPAALLFVALFTGGLSIYLQRRKI